MQEEKSASRSLREITAISLMQKDEPSIFTARNTKGASSSLLEQTSSTKASTATAADHRVLEIEDDHMFSLLQRSDESIDASVGAQRAGFLPENFANNGTNFSDY